jgi:hypothetical protein
LLPDVLAVLHNVPTFVALRLGDRRGIGNSHKSAVGCVHAEHHAEAGDWFPESILLNREVGDAWMVALRVDAALPTLSAKRLERLVRRLSRRRSRVNSQSMTTAPV